MFEYSSRPGAPLRNRTVDLLLTIATPPRPGRTTCTNGTPECSGSTACTQCARHPVHDSFHNQQAASGPHITLGDCVQVTHSERRTVTHGRAREPADQDARRPLRTRSYLSLCTGSLSRPASHRLPITGRYVRCGWPARLTYGRLCRERARVYGTWGPVTRRGTRRPVRPSRSRRGLPPLPIAKPSPAAALPTAPRGAFPVLAKPVSP